jgi:hypothetical protein
MKARTRILSVLAVGAFLLAPSPSPAPVFIDPSWLFGTHVIVPVRFYDTEGNLGLMTQPAALEFDPGFVRVSVRGLDPAFPYERNVVGKMEYLAGYITSFGPPGTPVGFEFESIWTGCLSGSTAVGLQYVDPGGAGNFSRPFYVVPVAGSALGFDHDSLGLRAPLGGFITPEETQRALVDVVTPLFADSLTTPGVALHLTASPQVTRENLRYLRIEAGPGNTLEGQSWEYSPPSTSVYTDSTERRLGVVFSDSEVYEGRPWLLGAEVPVGPVTIHFGMGGYTTATLQTTLTNLGHIRWTPVLVPDGTPGEGSAPSMLTPMAGWAQATSAGWINGGCAPAFNLAHARDTNGDGVQDAADVVGLSAVAP